VLFPEPDPDAELEPDPELPASCLDDASTRDASPPSPPPAENAVVPQCIEAAPATKTTAKVPLDK
jgi:hypothetical protein